MSYSTITVAAISALFSLFLCHMVWKRPNKWHITFDPKTKSYFGWQKSQEEDRTDKISICLVSTLLIVSTSLILA